MKKYNTEAIVLKSLNYKDKDKIYTLFTEEYGKISAIGRGVRKISSRRGGNLDSLNHISVKITERDNGFKDIDEVVTINSFKNIKSDYDLSLKGYYLAELISKNIIDNTANRDTTDIQLFKLFRKVLEIMDKNLLNIDLTILFFEVQLLKHLGYFPELPANENISTILKSLLKADFKSIDLSHIKETSVYVKNHMQNHLHDRMKSLEL